MLELRDKQDPAWNSASKHFFDDPFKEGISSSLNDLARQRQANSNHRQQQHSQSSNSRSSRNPQHQQSQRLTSMTQQAQQQQSQLVTQKGSQQLWRFLVTLLEDPACQHLICWAGRKLEFKLNEPEEVARLWGIQKNRPTMNYDKLSRSLRYYYEKGIISKVSGERYVYRFAYEPEVLAKLSLDDTIETATPSRPSKNWQPDPPSFTNQKVLFSSIQPSIPPPPPPQPQPPPTPEMVYQTRWVEDPTEYSTSYDYDWNEAHIPTNEPTLYPINPEAQQYEYAYTYDQSLITSQVYCATDTNCYSNFGCHEYF